MSKEERREHPRSSLAMPARVRKLCHDQPAIVRDLAVAGCRLETQGIRLEVGNRVLIRPSGFESLLGTVVWSDNENVGVKFDECLNQSVVDRFCRLHPEARTSALLDIAA